MVTWRKNERAVEDAGPYGSENGAVSKFENISKRADTSTSRAGATRGGITNNIKNHEASQKPPLRSNGAAHYRAERGSGSDKRSVSDSLYDDVQHLGFRGVRGDRFLTYPNRAGSLETCGFKQRFGHFWGCGQKRPAPAGAELSLLVTWRKNERAVGDAGPYKGLGESAPVSGGASMRAVGNAAPARGGRISTAQKTPSAPSAQRVSFTCTCVGLWVSAGPCRRGYPRPWERGTSWT